MDDYIVEFRKGDKVLEKRKFKTLDGKEGAELYVLEKSLGKNLDKMCKFIIKQKRGDWFKEYDNNGSLVSICGINPAQQVTNEALANILNKITQGKK